MNETYDPGAHLLAIALIVFYWHLLRLWHQPPPDSSDKPGEGKEVTAGASLQLPSVALRKAPAATADDAQSGPGPAARAGEALAAIHAADDRFDEESFLAGAARAYELIVGAYAEEDMKVLDGLLGPEAAADFREAIAERRLRGEKLAFTFIGFKHIEVVQAWVEADLAEITVRFTTEAVDATYGPDGNVVDGHPDSVVEMTDTWTFARRLVARDPNWKLVAT